MMSARWRWRLSPLPLTPPITETTVGRRRRNPRNTSSALRVLLPYIVDDGEAIGDSEAIIAHLIDEYRLGIDAPAQRDTDLSAPLQAAELTGVALRLGSQVGEHVGSREDAVHAVERGLVRRRLAQRVEIVIDEHVRRAIPRLCPRVHVVEPSRQMLHAGDA